MKSVTIPLPSLLRYGFIAMPVAFAGFPLYVLAPDYYAVHYQIPLGLMGFILLSLRLGDAVIDPVIGWLIDRFQGYLLWPVLLSSALLCLAIYSLFNLQLLNPALWFALCMGIAVLTHSLITITLGLCATLWTNNKSEQTKIAAIRESFGLIGLIMAVSMPALLGRLFDATLVYEVYGLLLCGLMGVALFGFIQILPLISQDNLTGREKLPSPFSIWTHIPKDIARLYFVYGLSMFASSIPAVLVVFFVRDLLDAEQLTGLFLAAYFLSGAAATPLWTKASRTFGKYKAWCLATLLAVASFVGASFLQSGDILPYLLICIVSGLALGADLTLAPSILSDQIHDNAHNNLSGTYYALMSFMAKAGLALASALSLSFLDFAGFKPQTNNETQALLILSITYALIPCLLKLCAAGFLYVFFIRTPVRRIS
jgi:GPH family glycoside/pentoside/hexuronide:cation symporter